MPQDELFRNPDTTALNSELAGQEQLYGTRIQLVLLYKYSGSQAILVVPLLNRHRSLKNDGACIHILYDEMDGAA